MIDSGHIGKVLALFGVILVVVGAWLAWGPRVPFLGRLPGDVRLEKAGFSFFFPLTTCLLLSGLASLIFWLIRRIK